MNDFTKEELEDLLTFAEVYTEFGASWTYKMHQPLMNKLKSMIDNYCEHDTEGGEIEIFADKCSKCDSIILRPDY